MKVKFETAGIISVNVTHLHCNHIVCFKVTSPLHFSAHKICVFLRCTRAVKSRKLVPLDVGLKITPSSASNEAEDYWKRKDGLCSSLSQNSYEMTLNKSLKHL